jgi:maltokinase
MSERLSLGGGIEVLLDARAEGWEVTPRRADGTPSGPGEGASEALVAYLLGGRELPERWQVLRIATLPAVAGERPIDVDQTNTSVVVGESVVVKWLRTVTDRPHPAMSALAQLGAVGFAQTPTTYAVLTWTSPRGHTLPVAYLSEYLTAARDGWTWCVDLVRSLADGGERGAWSADLPERVGRLTAGLHIALATPNHVFPRPVQTAGASRVQRWYDGAFAMLEEALDLPDAEAATAVSERADAISQCFDQVLGPDLELAGTPVQHIHGDLHVGQILRWSEGLAVVDFDGNPVAASDGGLMHPAARDVAQMTCSLDHVGRVVLHHHPDLDPAPVVAWMAGSRSAFLNAYRNTLQESGMSFLLDERLLPAFELEQELRELVYAARHLPPWTYAPLATLTRMLPGSPS